MCNILSRVCVCGRSFLKSVCVCVVEVSLRSLPISLQVESTSDVVEASLRSLLLDTNMFYMFPLDSQY